MYYMNDLELLNRIKNKDREAFVEFMKKYGEALYDNLLQKLGDRRLADAAFKETMIGFYKSLTENKGDDAVSALLSGYADIVSGRIRQDYLGDIIEKTADCAEHSQVVKLPLPVPEKEEIAVEEAEIEFSEPSCEETTEPISRAKWYLLVAVLGVCSAIILWIIIGLLCSMDVLPELNLGYNWFNNNISEWF